MNACQRSKTPEPNQTYFWQVSSSTLQWGACGDARSLRGGVGAIAVAENSFLVYRVDKSGKQAVSQTCPMLDPSTCRDSTTNIVFDIAVNELTYTSERTDMVANSTCKVRQNETWTLLDKVNTMSLEINTVLSLVGGTGTDCATLEANVKADSPNRLGVTGCVLTRQLTGALK